MSSSAELHLMYQVANAPLSMFPFPHFFIRNAFPADYYDEMQAMLPDPSAMVTISEARPVPKGAYKERFVLAFGGEQFAALPEDKRRFWGELHRWLVGGMFSHVVLQKFSPFINERFKGQQVSFYDEALLVQDTTNYALGPHSDTPRKVVTFLFYLPRDESQRHLGTSVYVPKDRNFRCPGGPHYPHANFDRVWTMPFLPNSLFVFLKTTTSFHGVEPIADADTRRWLLLYDIHHRVEGGAPQ
jgi:hypothetical protein